MGFSENRGGGGGNFWGFYRRIVLYRGLLGRTLSFEKCPDGSSRTCDGVLENLRLNSSPVVKSQCSGLLCLLKFQCSCGLDMSELRLRHVSLLPCKRPYDEAVPENQADVQEASSCRPGQVNGCFCADGA